jgi:hypothetical protein
MSTQGKSLFGQEENNLTAEQLAELKKQDASSIFSVFQSGDSAQITGAANANMETGSVAPSTARVSGFNATNNPFQMEAVVAFAIGLLVGVMLKTLGAKVRTLGAILCAMLAWILSVLLLSAFVNQPIQPQWIGFASLAFSVGLFLTVRVKKIMGLFLNTPAD